MTSKKPLVSTIIPVYNGEKYLAEAIESVLTQTYQDMEIIVVDDGSTDDTEGVAKSFKEIKYCLIPHSGAGEARNHGISQSCGEFLSFLDADDLWVSHKTERQLEEFRKDPALDMVFGHVEQFHEKKEVEIPGNLKVVPGYNAGTMMIRRGSFDRAGEFPIHWEVGEFIDWYARAREKGLTGILVSDIVLKRRIHDKNMGITFYHSRKDYVKILKNSLDRKRQEKKP